MADNPAVARSRLTQRPWFWRLTIGLGVGWAILLAIFLLFEVGLRIYYRRPLVERYFIAASNTAGYGLERSSRHDYLHNVRPVTVSIDGEGRRVVPGAGDQALETLYVIGDSQVFGSGLKDNESIPGRLQERLGPGWRVVNLGVPGYGPHEYAEALTQLPENAVALVIQTEANDVNDAYLPKPPVLPRCGYLVPRGKLGTSTPCFLLSSYALAAMLRLRNSVFGNSQVPLNYNPHAQVAARVLQYRIENLYRSALEDKSQRVLFAVIPWDAQVESSRLKNYQPRLSRAERSVRLVDDCQLEASFLQQANANLLFQDGDFHLSAAGADFVASALAPKVIEKASQSK